MTRIGNRLRWVLIVLLAIALAGGIGGVVAYRKLTGLTVWFVNRSNPKLKLSAGRIQLESWPASVRVENVRLELRATGEEVVAIPAAIVTFDWRDLPARRIDRVEILQPTLIMRESLFAGGGTAAGDERRESPTGLWYVEEFVVRDGMADIDVEASPRMTFKFGTELRRVYLSDDTRFSTSEQELVVRGLEVRDDDGALLGRVNEMKVRLRLDRIAEGQVEAVSVGGVSLRVAPGSLKYRSRADEPDGGTRQGTWDRWRVGEFRMEDAELRVEGFGPGVPEMSAKVSLRLENFGPGGALEPQVLRVTELAVSDAEGELVGVEDLEVRFSPRGLLVRKTVDAVTVRGTSLRVTPALLALAKLAPAGEGGEPSEWRIAELTLADGHLSVSGLGLPEINGDFGVRLEDFGPGSESPDQTLTLSNLRTPGAIGRAPIAQVEELTFRFSPAGVLERREIEGIEIRAPVLRLGDELRALTGASRQERPKPAASGAPWKAKSIAVRGGTVILEDLGFGMPPVEFRVDTALQDVALPPDATSGGDAPQTVELADLTVYSPLDPFVPVVSLRTVFLRFTLAGLLARRLDDVVVLNPTIFVGKDLFWYLDEMKRRGAAADGAPAAEPEPAWRVERLRAWFGKLVIARGGEPQVALPLSFETEANNLDLGNVRQTELKLNLVIPRGDYAFPAYKLEFHRLAGTIEFGLPPEEDANNLVHTLRVAEARWRQFEGRDIWLSVTYDADGIYGRFGGAAYAGYVNGAFDFLMRDGSPWTGWVTASDVGLEPLTQLMAPESFKMTGPADLRVEANGMTRQVERLKGKWTASAGGRMEIGKLDALLEKVPADWPALKQSLLRIGLEALRDFEYDSADGDFWYAAREGKLDLQLAGPGGARHFDVVLHPPQ